MFIFNLTYVKPISEVEAYLPAHIEYLEKNYEQGNFICSGRKNPRTGGIILCKLINTEEAQLILEQDPFFIHEIASYEVIEFLPSKCADAFRPFI